MDTLSHGLYGGVVFGRASRARYWLAFFFGVAPDLLSFGIYFVLTLFGLYEHPDWSSGQHPADELIPNFVHIAYQYTHSLLVFAIVFGVVWLLLRRPILEMLAWPLHILVDIPTHSTSFFATPFLWPLSDYRVDGWNWSQPIIFIPNLILLISLYAWWWFRRRPRHASLDQQPPGNTVSGE